VRSASAVKSGFAVTIRAALASILREISFTPAISDPTPLQPFESIASRERLLSPAITLRWGLQRTSFFEKAIRKVYPTSSRMNGMAPAPSKPIGGPWDIAVANGERPPELDDR